MSETIDRGGLGTGWEHLRRGRWTEARSFFASAVSQQGSAEAWEGLSWAAWWLDDIEALFEARERAFRAYRESDDAASAARMATWLGADQLDVHGALAAASGWLERASRLLEPLEVGPDHGWLFFHQGFVAYLQGDSDRAIDCGARAAELGRSFAVADLEMLGLALEGMCLVVQARVSDGMRCLDEASVMALAGEAAIPISSAWTCCFMVTACTQIFDFERAFEWCDRIAEFAERYDSRYMLGFCRAEYATIHMWRGRWEQAEQALEESLTAFAESRPAMMGGAAASLAELRRRKGQTEASRELLDRLGPSSQAQLCRARLALERGEWESAVDLGQRVLRNTADDRLLAQVPALELIAQANVVGGDHAAAAAAVERLDHIVGVVGTPALAAKAALAGGIVAAAAGDLERARPLLEDAIDGFERCRAPFESATARIELAGILGQLGRTDEARQEARLACNVLEEMGARPLAGRARALADDRPTGAAPEAELPISPREQEVLMLLTEGLTNRQISTRLCISEHTVHRHVTSILRKLDMPSRAAAAVYAVQLGLGRRQDP